MFELSRTSFYQRLVGTIIYLSFTQQHIAFAASLASHFMHSLYEKHLKEES